MDIISVRAKIIKELGETSDEHLIKAVHELLKYAKSAKSGQALQPFTVEELVARAKRSEEDIRKGRVTELNQLRKKIKEW